MLHPALDINLYQLQLMFIIYSPKPITVSKTTVTHVHVVTFQRRNKSVEGNLILLFNVLI